MHVLTIRPSARALACALAASALAAAGCGSTNNDSAGGSTATTSASSTPVTAGGPDAKAAGEVPAAVKSKGTLTVAADASYAPNEFFAGDGKTVQGTDADLAKALAGKLGLKAKVVNATFDGIIPGLASGKYDLGMSSFTDTKEREKTVDFVTYLTAGTSFYTKANGGPDITDLASLCGHKVAAEKGTTQADDATAQAKKCKAAGKPAVAVAVFPDQNGANLAINSGRADVGMADSPVADYQVKQSGGQFKVVGQTYGTAPYGIAIPKGNGMAPAVRDGLLALMKDGTYKKVLAKWGVQSGAIDTPVINGATS
ncbi:MAG: polar amino acid transport system substrate-binding protein [Baekduia sp.]|nr:polar amino acid transport system substrate-binding protein [Baekduia sp.]